MTIQLDIKGRFARSVTLDRDSAAEALDGYLPTGRSLDVLRRVARGLGREDAARAFSITGPYGSGKSSLAVLLDAALGPAHTAEFSKSRQILRHHAPDVLAELDKGRKTVGAERSGFVRAVITAPQREPVLTTVLRALHRGTQRAELDLAEAARGLLDRALSVKYSSPTFDELFELLAGICQKMPVLLLIDEFGKNLEAFADAGSDGDLYLLQELAELTQGSDRLPLIVATIQHLAFEAYAADASATQRREWAKVQGRLEDIPFLDSPAATRRLLAAALVHDPDETAAWLRHEAAHHESSAAEELGLAEVSDRELVAACWPMHPSVLLVLPDLCARYGQNERTLFSFLASDAPSSAKTVLAASDDPMPWVRLDAVYDYFVESASTFVGASRDASRWIEIETTIRDAHGLTEPQRRVLKAIGVFNLVAAVGTVRASANLLTFALSGGGDGLQTSDDVTDRLAELVRLGIVVHRDFAGEYRIWRGSDFDLDGALSSARRRARERRPAELLNSMAPLAPVVAARHAIQHGTVRAFERRWAGEGSIVPSLPAPESALDGLLLYSLDNDGGAGAVPDNPHDIPVVVVAADPSDVIAAAIEVAALEDVAGDQGLRSDDHAVHRELRERVSHARGVLNARMTETYGSEAHWSWAHPRQVWTPPATKTVGTSFLSAALDTAYNEPWRADYEAINRAELSSAGARGRGVVLNALANPATRALPGLGLTGHGADVAIYHAVLASSGLHSSDGVIAEPRGTRRAVWDTLMRELDGATAAPVSVTHLLDAVMAPPHGLRAGVAGIVLVTALLHRAADIAVYEHGTFKPRLDGALVERMVRNPRNFSVKYLAASDGRSTRGRVVRGLAERLGVASQVLPVTTALVRLVAGKGKHVRTTRRFGYPPDETSPAVERRLHLAGAIRDAILDANQPDELLFEQLPAALSFPPATATGGTDSGMRREDVDDFVEAVGIGVQVLSGTAERLVQRIAQTVLAEATHSDSVTRLAAYAESVTDVDTITSEVRTFAGQAILAGMADTTEAWVTSLATACTGTPPTGWTDNDIGANLRKLSRVAADFRRVAYLALQAEHTDTEDAFAAYVLSATGSDGRSHDTVVAVPESLISAGEKALRSAVASLGDDLGLSDARATELLTGILAKSLINPESVSSDSRPVELRHGNANDTKGWATA